MIVLVPGFLQSPDDLSSLGEALVARGLDEERRDLLELTRGADAEEAARRLAAGLTETAVLVGYSMGGRLALNAALRPEARLRGLVLLSASPGLDDETARAGRRAVDEQRARELTRRPEQFVRTWGELPLFASLRRTPAFAPLEQRRITRFAGATGRARVEGWAHALRALGPGSMPSRWHALAALQVPALFLAGSLDPAYADLALAAASRCPRARSEVLAGVGHALPLEAPKEVAARIAAFCAQLSPTPKTQDRQTPWKEDHP